MSFANPQNHGAQDHSSGSASSIPYVPGVANVGAGRVAYLWAVSDNVSAGETNEHTGCTDTQGNAWAKLFEFAYGGTVPNADGGCTVSVWKGLITTELEAGVDVVTVTLSEGQTAKKAGMISFDYDGVPTLVEAEAVGAGGNSASVAVSGMNAATEYLLLAILGAEGAIDNYVQDSDYTGANSANGTDSSTVTGRLAYRIATVTGDTYAVSWQNNRDYVLMLLALEDAAPGGGSIAPISAYYRMMGMR